MSEHFKDLDGDNILDSAEIIAALEAEHESGFEHQKTAHQVLIATDIALLKSGNLPVETSRSLMPPKKVGELDDAIADLYKESFDILINRDKKLSERFANGVDFAPEDVEEVSTHGGNLVIIPLERQKEPAGIPI